MRKVHRKERYTIKDYYQWEGDWELIDGRPVALASPGALHQFVATYLAHMFISQMDECPTNCFVATELDWIVDESNVLRPDILVICGHKPDSEHIKITPNLVVEVVSAQSRPKDEIVKFQIYQRKQVPYYILVYPEEKVVRIFEFREGKYEQVYEGSGQVAIQIGNCSVNLNLAKLFERI